MHCVSLVASSLWFLEVNFLALSFQRLKETMTDIYSASGNAMGEAKVDV